MTTLHRSVRQTPSFTVVRVRRIKRQAAPPIRPRSRAPSDTDLSSLILYGQG